MFPTPSNHLLLKDTKTPKPHNPSPQGIGSNFDSHELQSISPILQQNKKQFTGDFLSKPSNNKLASPDQDQIYFMDMQTPSSLVKNLYQNPSMKAKADQDLFYKRDSADFLGSINDEDQYEEQEEEQDFVTAKKELKNHIKMKKSESGTCTEFDLIAQEIHSNKRSEKTKVKPAANGRQSDSRKGDEDVIKWAISKDSQQETQKKGSSKNPLDLISKTLKSHDSYTSNLQPHLTLSSNNNPLPTQIKGKVLDFGDSEQSQKYSQFGLLQANSSQKKFMLPTDESNMLKQEQEMISFLEDDNDEANILISTLQKKSLLIPNKKGGSQTTVDGLRFQMQKLADVLQDIIENNIDCQFCFEQKMFHSSLDYTQIEGPKARKQIIEENLNKKYLTSREYYNVKIINDVIYNENTHIVSVFKDYLIFDDVSEFLKRSYTKSECLQRLPRMYEFYEKYSKVFPNYVILPENKYMFKNIEKKQRLQDEKQRIIQEQQQKKSDLDHSRELQRNRHKDRFSQRQHQNSSSISQLSNNRMFSTNFIDSVMNIQPSGVIELSVTNSKINISTYQDHVMNSSILIQQQLKENMDKSKKNKEAKKKGRGGLEDLDLDELISKFIARDTESNIHESLLQSETKPQNPILKKEEFENENAKKAKAKVYDYSQKPIPHAISVKANEISKQSDNSGARPSSGKQQTHYDHRRLSTGSNNVDQQAQPKSNNIYYEDQKHEMPQSKNNKENLEQEMKEEAKILNYNIINIRTIRNDINNCEIHKMYFDKQHVYNNFNQYINNENYYISTEKDQANKDQEGIKEKPQDNPQSLSRTQSRSNLMNSGSINNRVSTIQQQQNIQTPSKMEKVTDKKTPTSGSVGRKGQVQKQIRKRYIQQNEDPKSLVDSGHQPFNRVQVQEQNECISINDNKSTNSMQRISIEPVSNVSPRSLQQREHISKMIASGKITKSVNSNVLTSREMSKEKPQKQIVTKPLATIQNPQVSSNNQMFKNEQLSKQQQQLVQQRNPLAQSLDQDYLQSKQAQIHSSNVRSIERLKLIDEEIEYSKYQNEYGLTKTAFAKAVNQLREKTLQQEQDQLSKDYIRAQTSNEKGRKAGSNTNRASSTSQSRKQSQNKLRSQTNLNQESANDLYMNTNTVRQDQPKNIRSIRAKTHLSSQNSSSCYQKSQKLSPDKNIVVQVPPNQLNTLQNVMLCNQTDLTQKHYLQQQPNFITLKSQPNQNVKGLKIKFPLAQQTSRGNSSSKNILQKSNNNNQSQTQTPKRLKLQKTRSTSNILGGVSSKVIPHSNHQNIFTHRGRVPELGILDQISQQYGANPQLSATSKDILNQISSLGINPLQLTSMNDFNMQSIDSTANQNYAYPSQYPFAASCGGTYATTSILNSPLSFKSSAVLQRNNSKGRASSRNGNQSSHQSQKSITAHQRASSTANNLLIGSNNKAKSNKRMSAGSNLSKNQKSVASHNNPGGVPNSIQNQLIQLYLAYQNNQQQSDTDLGTTASNLGSQIPLSQTLQSIQNQVALGQQQSMKNLKSMKQPSSGNTVQIIKPNKIKQGALIMQSQSNNSASMSNLQTQRQSTQQPTILGQMIQNKNGSKTTKNTARGDSKKKVTTNVQPYTSNEASSRLVQGIGNMDSTLGNQDARKLLSYSRSQESLDLIKMLTQKAAQEQMQQQQQSNFQYNHSGQQNKQILQNLKQSANQADNQILFQKVKLQNPVLSQQQESIPYSYNQTMSLLQQQQHYQQPPPALQSVRNLQFQIQSGNSSTGGQYGGQQQQFQFKGSDYEGIPHSSKTPTTILLPQDKTQSRRTSAKFNPSSTKNN